MSVPEYFIGNVYVWLGDMDTVRPAAPNIAPAASDWTLMGTTLGTGADQINIVNLPDEGVTWEVTQTINPERDLNDVFPSDGFRVEADQMVNFSLKDFRAEIIQNALNGSADNNLVTISAVDNAATPKEAGYRQLGVSAMGVAVTKVALLVRVDNSPYQVAGAGYVSEFWTPSCYEMSNFSTVLGSRAASMVPFQFMSILSRAAANVNDRMGSWRFEDTAITP